MSNYESRINIGLPVRAPVSDPQVFPAVQNLHNAVHTLNAAFDQVVDLITPPKDASFNNLSFSFRMSSFWGTIAPGQELEVNKPATLKGDGFHKGAYAFLLSPHDGRPMTVAYGWVLEIDEENSQALMGWPPAIVEVTGVSVGDVLYAKEKSGQFFLKNMADGLPGSSDGINGYKFHPIGHAVGTDQLLLAQNLVKHKLFNEN
ncbi:hypothetical protein [Candidatus Macondimonas diazotrophica]|jgi:hypothetical protein|uniref:Uncharacterized protein n=1 Tax=Candidatus Macondimonas diazotrophica TaxID=2305248 RepID=A0A4Z0F5Z3_9GAMM|nr:hypothetical protein [Candidatus Macondimonas diazotrophica]TFZ81661.1 hypothetical protein E4680_11365 [Candidatus Macondimonas diazotrophica]